MLPHHGFGDALDWIRSVARDSRQVRSVCTGSLLLAKAGLLAGKRATTHRAALAELEALGSGVEVVRDPRWVDDVSSNESLVRSSR